MEAACLISCNQVIAALTKFALTANRELDQGLESEDLGDNVDLALPPNRIE